MSHCDVDHFHSNNNEHMLTWYINNMVWNIMARLRYEFVVISVIRLVIFHIYYTEKHCINTILSILCFILIK